MISRPLLKYISLEESTKPFVTQLNQSKKNCLSVEDNGMAVSKKCPFCRNDKSTTTNHPGSHKTSLSSVSQCSRYSKDVFHGRVAERKPLQFKNKTMRVSDLGKRKWLRYCEQMS